MTCRRNVVDATTEVCGIAAADLTDDATLEALGVDSLDLIEIAMVMEGVLGVQVSAEDFEGVATFGAAVAVFDRLAESAGT